MNRLSLNSRGCKLLSFASFVAQCRSTIYVNCSYLKCIVEQETEQTINNSMRKVVLYMSAGNEAVTTKNSSNIL